MQMLITKAQLCAENEVIPFYCFEMTKEEVVERMIHASSCVSNNLIQERQMTDEKWNMLEAHRKL